MSSTTVSPALVKKIAQKYGIDPVVGLRQLTQESGLRRNVGSPAGAQGVAQFMPATAKAYGVNLHDGRSMDDLEGWGKMMSSLLKQHHGDYRAALSAYNSGRPDGWQHIAETRNYVDVILKGIGTHPAGHGAPSHEPAKGAKGQPTMTTTTEALPSVTTTPDTGPQKLAALQHLARGDVLGFAAGIQDARALEVQGAKTYGGGDVTHVQVTPGAPGAPAATGKTGGKVHPSGTGKWGGSESVIDPLDRVAATMGIKPGSTKRSPGENASVGGAPGSDHLTTNTSAYAKDYPTSGQAGTTLAERIAKQLGVRFVPNSYDSGGLVRTKHGTFKVQILYGAGIDHADHVHVGAHRVG